MQHFHLKTLVPNSPLNFVPQTRLRPVFTYVVDGEHLQPTMIQSSSRVSFLKNVYRSFTIPNSILRVHSNGTLQLGSSQIGQDLQQQVDKDSYEDQSRNKETQVDSFSESLERVHEDYKEAERRRKISIANKGKIPWNKGRKHNAETREKIRRRTTEALGDPKVRQKMSSCPRFQSEENKVKISIAQKQVWRKRLIRKGLKEKFYLRWVESIAETAKIGWSDQQELDWDSYEKIKEEIIFQRIQAAADKVRAREIRKLRAARAAKEKEEKMAWLAQKREERQQKAKARGEIKRKTHQWTEEEKRQLALSKDLRLKEKITKIREKARRKMLRQKKALHIQVASIDEALASERQPAIENLDLEFIEKEKMRREVSLADQIRAVKMSKTESTMKEALISSSSDFLVDEII